MEIYIRCFVIDLIESGARRAKVDEPLVKAEEYPIEWREPRFDLAELAVLRWVKKNSIDELAKTFGRTPVAIQNQLQELRRKNFRVSGLSEQDREKIQTLERERLSKKGPAQNRLKAGGL